MKHVSAAQAKLSLLFHGIDIDIAAIPIVGYKTDKYLHNDRHAVARDFKLAAPQELLLSDGKGPDLCVGVLTRPGARWELRWSGTEPFLTFDNMHVDIEVGFPSEPSFWKLSTSDGVPMYKLLSVPGLNELNLWPWHDCALHYQRVGCAFCTTTATAVRAGTGPKSELLTVWRLMNTNDDADLTATLVERCASAVGTALSSDFESQEYWFTIISGNLPNDQLDRQHDMTASLLGEVLRRVPSLRPDRVVVNIMPPQNSALIERIRDAGACYYMANLELWGSSDFERLCPGKALYGRTKFLHMLSQAVHVFGEGKVWCNFVAGLEPLSNQLDGYRELAKLGVTCGANIFHADPGVSAEPSSDFDLPSLHRYYIQAAEILHREGLTPFYSMSSRRSSLLWEAFVGLL